jgi:cytoskeletal protein CcmA (bactofilin family)
MAVGRISGPLLKDNLLRNGVNLSFETNLLYIDVVNSRVGVKTTAPQYDLDVDGTTRSTYLYTTTQADIATITVTGSTISSSSNTINFTPNGTNPTIFSGTIKVGNLSLTGNTLSSTDTNGDITIAANGTGGINLNSNVTVTGNLHATGNITADGNIQLGDNLATDTVSFTGEVNSNILPSTNVTYNLGSSSLQWNNIYAQTANVTNFNITNFTATSLSTTGSPSLTIAGNTLTASGTNADINFSTPGTGGVLLGNFKFYKNTITNTVPNSITQFTQPTYSFSGYIAPANTEATLDGGSITGTTLTFVSSSGATVQIGQLLSGGTVADGTYIVSGSGTSWTVSNSQTATCTTATSIILTVTSSTAGTITSGVYITSGATSNTLITASSVENSNLTGAGATGTYSINISQTVGSIGSSVAMTGVGAGYVKIQGTYGLVIPTGDDLNRPALAYTEVGMVRFNTAQQYVEVYNGNSWTSIAGLSSGISVGQASDIALGIVISLG